MAEGNSVSQALTQTNTMLPLQDRVAIVTGGSRGIGQAIALHLASLGAKLVVNYTSNSNQADLVAAQINSSSGPSNSLRAIVIQADISDPVQVKSLFDKAVSAFNSPPHILVNSAGILNPECPYIADTTVEDFDRIISVNTRGAFLCCREAANRIKRGGGGRIICVSSSVAALLSPGYGAYTASKAAVDAMVSVLAKELKGTGITANCVSPGAVATDMFFGVDKELVIAKSVIEATPLGKLAKPEDMAPLVGFLASDAGEWVNGQAIRINGGII